MDNTSFGNAYVVAPAVTPEAKELETNATETKAADTTMVSATADRGEAAIPAVDVATVSTAAAASTADIDDDMEDVPDPDEDDLDDLDGKVGSLSQPKFLYTDLSKICLTTFRQLSSIQKRLLLLLQPRQQQTPRQIRHPQFLLAWKTMQIWRLC